MNNDLMRLMLEVCLNDNNVDCFTPKQVKEMETYRRKSPVRAVVTIEGGMVQSVVADTDDVTVLVLDFDTEGADADDEALTKVNGMNCFATDWDAMVNGADVDRVWKEALGGGS